MNIKYIDPNKLIGKNKLAPFQSQQQTYESAIKFHGKQIW